MKKVVVLLCVLALASFAMAQATNGTYAAGATGGIPLGNVDKLGAHMNGGRGCVGCHTPHSGAKGNAMATSDANTGDDALWGQDLTPFYGKSIAFGDNGNYTSTLPATFAVADEEIRGIMMCLSCHDGTVAKGAMMTNKSWEQTAGLLPKKYDGTPLYGSADIPTLLGADGTTGMASGTLGSGNYNNDHPVGKAANLGKLGIASRFTVGTGSACGSATFSGNCLTTTDTAYVQFVANYGAPSVLPGRASFIVVEDSTPGNAYVVCTTCHTPHSMFTYNAGNTPGGKIAGNTSGVYPSYFFINAPYNPGANVGTDGSKASSALQFCRQCHFTGAGGSNEGSGIMNVKTAF